LPQLLEGSPFRQGLGRVVDELRVQSDVNGRASGNQSANHGFCNPNGPVKKEATDRNLTFSLVR
jgi:hypothetical protein